MDSGLLSLISMFSLLPWAVPPPEENGVRWRWTQADIWGWTRAVRVHSKEDDGGPNSRQGGLGSGDRRKRGDREKKSKGKEKKKRKQSMIKAKEEEFRGKGLSTGTQLFRNKPDTNRILQWGKKNSNGGLTSGNSVPWKFISQLHVSKYFLSVQRAQFYSMFYNPVLHILKKKSFTLVNVSLFFKGNLLKEKIKEVA